LKGVIYYDWKYILEADFANDAVRVRDAYLEYQGFKIADDPLLLRGGNFKTFNTFEEETSANYLDTMERAAFISAWNIDRQIGFGTMYYAEHFGLAGGVFGQRFPATQDNPLFPGFTGDEDLTFAARAYAAPISDLSNYPFFIPQDPDRPPGSNNDFDGATIKGFGMRMHVDW
jgi:phosphate-selective porin OprO/OprP